MRQAITRRIDRALNFFVSGLLLCRIHREFIDRHAACHLDFAPCDHENGNSRSQGEDLSDTKVHQFFTGSNVMISDSGVSSVMVSSCRFPEKARRTSDSFRLPSVVRITQRRQGTKVGAGMLRDSSASLRLCMINLSSEPGMGRSYRSPLNASCCSEFFSSSRAASLRS